MELRLGGLDDPAVADLLRLHLADTAQYSPPQSVHALDPAALAVPEISFWTAWDGAALLGCGALKALGGGEGEIKSMRTAPFVCARASRRHCWRTSYRWPARAAIAG